MKLWNVHACIFAFFICNAGLIKLGTCQENANDCVSQEEFDALAQNLAVVEAKLQQWQSTTLDILKQYLLDNPTLLIDRVEEKLDTLQHTVAEMKNTSEDLHAEIQPMRENISTIAEQLKNNFESDCPTQILQPLLTSQQTLNQCQSELEARSNASTCVSYHNGDQETVQAYCGMNGVCTGGWERVAYLNMNESTQQCPQGLHLIDTPIRTCGKSDPGVHSCPSIFYGTTRAYSRVCGRITAYQVSTPDAFSPSRYGSLDGYYVDGISITHGRPPRKHIWTFAAAVDEVHSNRNVCPCTNAGYTGTVPTFINNDYFCETGSREHYQYPRFYHEDPLWNGRGCGPNSSCCEFNSPPWFCKQLNGATTDDIELRVCSSSDVEDIAIELIELFVQ